MLESKNKICFTVFRISIFYRIFFKNIAIFLGKVGIRDYQVSTIYASRARSPQTSEQILIEFLIWGYFWSYLGIVFVFFQLFEI